jgi:hypothetical protein
MLELLIGIPLTIAAWKRGWKGWALLPLILALVTQAIFGFFVGFTASPGTAIGDLEGLVVAVSLVIDLIAAAALIGMIVKERKPEVPTNTVVDPVASASNHQSARFCTGCGQKINDNAAFCRNCGARIGWSASPEGVRDIQTATR